MKQIQYFMDVSKEARIISHTLWLEDGEEKGKLTFSKRDTPNDIWEPQITMKSTDSEDVMISEIETDYFLAPLGFTVKEVIENS